MKIRITQEGFQTYNGQMGVLFFENGLSTTDARPQDAMRLAAQFICEWEDGTSASLAQAILDHSHATTSTVPQEMNADQALKQLAADTPTVSIAKAQTYTEADLQAIADKSGIKGLRAIGDALGIKNNSIPGLMAEILAKQA